MAYIFRPFAVVAMAFKPGRGGRSLRPTIYRPTHARWSEPVFPTRPDFIHANTAVLARRFIMFYAVIFFVLQQ